MAEIVPGSEIVEADGIPLIDLYPLISPEPDSKAMDALVLQISEGCKKWGFFQVINHGVSFDLLENIDSFSRKLFAMSLEEKKKISSSNQLIKMGYHDFESAKETSDWREDFQYVTMEPMIMPASPDPKDKELAEIFNSWPENLPGMRETCMEYGRQMEQLAHKLMELIALSLGLSRDRFREFFRDPMSEVLLFHYPKSPDQDLVLGAIEHKDTSALTIYADDVQGLDVKRKIDGQWHSVQQVPQSYSIIVGDVLQVWSNDKYESVEHRVKLNSEKERFSYPFFFHVSHYTTVQPLEELVDEQKPAKYSAYNMGKYYAAKFL